MKHVALQEFRQDIEEILDKAAFEPVSIILPDGRRLILMSEEAYLSARRGPRRALHVSELSDKDAKAIAEAKVPDGLDHLNALLDEEDE